MKQFFGIKSRNTLALVIMVSFLLHVVAIVIFGTIKFVSALRDEEKVFEAAPVETPPQNEPEYTVNFQQRNQSTPPPRPPAIVVNNPSELDIPALDIDVNVDSSSVYGRGGGGFGDGLSGIREMAIDDLKLTDFGYTGRAAGTLEGILVDLKRTKSGSSTGLDAFGHRVGAIREFSDGAWTASRLTRKYYTAENKLYASYWIIPMGSAAKAPQSFGVEGEIEPSGIVAYYEGSYVPEKNMEMRFCGGADDVLIVKLDSKIVFDGSLRDGYSSFARVSADRPPTRPIGGINTQTCYGEWVKLEAGKTYDLKVLVAEVPGGGFGAMLFYQTKGNDQLRVFSTKRFTSQEKKLLEVMHTDIVNGL